MNLSMMFIKILEFFSPRFDSNNLIFESILFIIRWLTHAESVVRRTFNVYPDDSRKTADLDLRVQV